MDQSVLDAIARWPNVPAVAGWLSLSPRGEWRLHPIGDAQQGGAGVSVSNPQILSFFGRNYACEPNGQYFFQNGPQRVYVRLDAAPYILHLIPAEGVLRAHHGTDVSRVEQWILDERGYVYAETDLGPARIDDRDLMTLADLLIDENGKNLLDIIERDDLAKSTRVSLRAHSVDTEYVSMSAFAPLRWIQSQDIGAELKFVANPTVPVKSNNE